MNDPIPMTDYEHRKATRPMRWWYESLADYMLAHPQATQGEIATHFGRAESTISLIIHSDAFSAYYRQRRADVADQLNEAVRAKLFGVATTSLDYLLVALEKKRHDVPIEMLHRTTDMALRNLGYGATPSGATVNVAPTVVNVAVSVADLEAARAALRRSQTGTQAPPPLIDAGELPDDPADSPPTGDGAMTPSPPANERNGE